MAFDNVLINSRWEFEGAGLEPVAVQTISGLKIEFSKVEFSVGADKPMKKQKGRKMVDEITLGVISFEDDDAAKIFIDWLNSNEKKDCYAKIFDSNGNVVRRWSLIGVQGGAFSEADLDRGAEGEPIIPEATIWADDAEILID